MATLKRPNGWLLHFAFFASLLAQPSVANVEIEKIEPLIGQMVLAGFKGKSPEDPGVERIAHAISRGKLGGVILYKHNIESPEQLKRLCDYLHNSGPGPLFIAVDQEGGKVQRLQSANGFTDYPSHQQIAQKKYTFEQAYTVYREMALELKRYGINVNFAPVVDLSINPKSRIIAQYERSFSSDPAVATDYARAFIKAHRDVGVLTTIKHWPGHGSAAEDSHLGIVDVTSTWSYDEQLPYESLIRSGDVDAVMTAHVFHRAFDKHRPATLSPAIIQGMLREGLGFEGVVFTDCLQMGAIRNLFGDRTEEAALQAIEGGADIMLISNFDADDSNFVDRFLAHLQQCAKDDEHFAIGRLTDSNRRILELKKRLLVSKGRDEL